MTRCPRPTCQGPGEGAIDEHGFCETCGAAGTPAPASHVAISAAPAIGPAEGEPCERHGPPGVIVGGFCTECAMPPRATPARTGPPPAAVSGPSIQEASAPSASVSTNTLRSTPGRGESGRGTGTGRIRGLGAGLVDVPSVPHRDPLSAVLADPEVPERKRFCGHCGDYPVGRDHVGRPARTEGFCPQCGNPYSFTPKLRPGDRVNNQYLVSGCIAHGGLGWIYLAQNLNLETRSGFQWVVLKGLLDSGDQAAMAAAQDERQFLTEVKHPNIVQIYNFVQHEGAGYIVMEYVGGQSLREIRASYRNDSGTPLPVAHAIEYTLGMLPAFAYLHDQGLLFCDFKPDNAICTGQHMTLIDLGGVKAIDADEESDVWGTIGYQAPEVPEVGPSITSDLYTVGRTLAVLCVDIPGYQDPKRHATKLPPATEIPVFARYEAFHQFLQKATAADPASRFQSADEMAEQLLGVLRLVRAVDGEDPRPAPSLLFSHELGNGAEASGWPNLPVPAVDPADPAVGVLATVISSDPEEIRSVMASTPRTPEVALRLARAFIDTGDLTGADAELDSPEARSTGWRAIWWRGVRQLAASQPVDAVAFFAAVAGELPGELAPRLALAVAYELAAVDPDGPGSTNGGPPRPGRPDDLRQAARLFDVVGATDPGFASASFGLARVETTLGNRGGAVTALQRIPGTSSSFAAAQIALCGTRCIRVHGRPPALTDLAAASDILAHLRADPSVRLALARDLHREALAMLQGGAVTPDPQASLGGAPLTEDGQRAALETTYRSLARLAHTDVERFGLVDLANASRPRTLT